MSEPRKNYLRPLDVKHGRVDMAHGAGGRAMAQLIDELFAHHLDNEWLAQSDDGAVLPAPDDEVLDRLTEEMVDRFGVLPPQTANLFQVARLRLRAAALGIRKLELGALGGRVLFFPNPPVDALVVIRMVQKLPKVYALDGPDKLKVRLELPGAAERLRTAGDILRVLGGQSG